jgi:hypothetical protein
MKSVYNKRVVLWLRKIINKFFILYSILKLMKKTPCLICQKATAINNCNMCGTPVCKEHYINGLCSDCKRGKIINEGS